MADKKKIDPETHKKQIQAYTAEFPYYEIYADTLKRVLENACKTSFPEASVQSRPKSVSSFAEKAARKFDRFSDAVNQMDDLCGGRVIVQTTEQVKAVRRFIEANFKIVEKEDKGLLLSEQEFGYRDMHYIVELCPDRDKMFGISSAERAAILDRKAEIQVRTWLQHAWADTLHDRIYKNKMNISFEAKRTGNLLAALMEEGDRNFSQLADELDGLIANYTAIAPKEEIENEIEIQELILRNETKITKKQELAMKLARLLTACGKYERVVELLIPHQGMEGASRCELLLDLGYALCRLHRNSPSSTEYRQGCNYLEQALNLCEITDVPFVPNLRKGESLHARALSRLGWALDPISSETERARGYYQQAHEHEPDNPYYLANMLGLEMIYGNRTALPANMRTVISEAVKTCNMHAAAEIELPSAYFTGGRLNLILGKANEALGCYARGIRHCLSGIHCVPEGLIAGEMEWLTLTHKGAKLPQPYKYAIDLLGLANRIQEGKPVAASSPLKAPILIIAGGADSMDVDTLKLIHPLVLAGLGAFPGTVIAGGTTIGVPGCVGDVAAELAGKDRKKFKLVGYTPDRLPRDVSAHKNYDISISIGDDFLPDQILRNWRDILDAGIKPEDVRLVGFGGGSLSAVEYRIALGLGASVGIVDGLEGAAEGILSDPLWTGSPNLYPLPFDPTTVRAFIISSTREFEDKTQEEMAKSFHAQYVANSPGRLPANMKPWPKLDDTFKKANIEQAKYSVVILDACGFGVKEVGAPPKILEDFTDAEVDRMAEMEHGRWNVERLRDGWRYGKVRNDSKKVHDCLVPWSELPEEIKHYDWDAVRAFPKILAQAGLEVYRR